MKITELMIGNWVQFGNPVNNDLPKLKITAIWTDLFWLSDGSHASVNNENIIGIPLTPGIMEKAGFVKCDLGYGYIHFGVEKYHFELNDYGCDVMYCDDLENQHWFRILRSNYINYLHQLQNLYFALTGIELTVNF